MIQILVIDDDTNICTLIAEMLEYEGYRPLTATTGTKGVQLARDARPDLILCDVMMPGLDGYGVLQALQNDAATATIPVIFITAKSNMGDVQRATGRSAAGYLSKPFVPGDLFAAIEKSLKK